MQKDRSQESEFGLMDWRILVSPKADFTKKNHLRRVTSTVKNICPPSVPWGFYDFAICASDGLKKRTSDSSKQPHTMFFKLTPVLTDNIKA